MDLGNALHGAVGLLAGALAVFWWRRNDLQDNPMRRFQVPFAIFLAVVSLSNLVPVIAGLAG